MFLVINEIRKNKKKFTLIILIIFLISYLVFFLTGLAYGLGNANRSAIDLWDADSIVLSDGSSYSLLGSIIDYEEFENLDSDVRDSLSPINISRSIFYKNSIKDDESTFNITMLGIDYKSEINPEILEGSFPNKINQVLASIDLKNDSGFKIGDILEDAKTGRELEIVGFSKPSKFSVSSVVYCDLFLAAPGMREVKPLDAVSSSTFLSYEEIPDMPRRIAGIVVHKEGINLEDIGLSTEEYDLVPLNKFINKLPGYKAQVLTFGLMIGFLVAISSIVIGVFIYIMNLQKKNIFAVMKVQGISDSYIGKSVFIQTFILSVIGIALGFALSYLSGIALPSGAPFEFNYLFFVVDSILILITALLASIFSVRSVAKINALDALK